MIHRGPRQLGAVGGPQQDSRLRWPLRLHQHCTDLQRVLQIMFQPG